MLLLHPNQSVPPQSARPSCRPHFSTGAQRITHHQKIWFIPLRSFAGLLLSVMKLLCDTRSGLGNTYSQRQECSSKRKQMLSLGSVALKAAICEWISAGAGSSCEVVLGKYFCAGDRNTPLPIKKLCLFSLSLLSASNLFNLAVCTTFCSFLTFFGLAEWLIIAINTF